MSVFYTHFRKHFRIADLCTLQLVTFAVYTCPLIRGLQGLGKYYVGTVGAVSQ